MHLSVEKNLPVDQSEATPSPDRREGRGVCWFERVCVASSTDTARPGTSVETKGHGLMNRLKLGRFPLRRRTPVVCLIAAMMDVTIVPCVPPTFRRFGSGRRTMLCVTGLRGGCSCNVCRVVRLWRAGETVGGTHHEARLSAQGDDREGCTPASGSDEAVHRMQQLRRTAVRRPSYGVCVFCVRHFLQKSEEQENTDYQKS